MQVFVSLLLVGGSVILFLFTVKQRDFDHADRLALMPVDDDGLPARAPTDSGESRHSRRRRSGDVDPALEGNDQ